ncbi:hypothetical protein HME9304_00189 [Flagellimonas maritima]|uniref:Uncharacterized protein n=1 Tax=Flagellimonas maritima TaxID=1383885 RepID=A0A2Z4LN13_9FLAO|nr:hypothetical protein [Allomuricauda aurantiaca]AWX43202.1 hypothetical protein HME9304_00189 [Allomuricauda aurantiaca]
MKNKELSNKENAREFQEKDFHCNEEINSKVFKLWMETNSLIMSETEKKQKEKVFRKDEVDINKGSKLNHRTFFSRGSKNVFLKMKNRAEAMLNHIRTLEYLH